MGCAAIAAALVLLDPPARADEAAPAHVPFIQGQPFAEVLKLAREKKKPVMVDVFAVWCGPCKFLDKVTFSDPVFTAWAVKNVVPFRVDAEKGQGRNLVVRYAVASFPTILFLDGNGNEIDRLAGAFRAPEFQKAAENIVSGKTPLQEGIAKLREKWDAGQAVVLASALAQRNDLPRLRPLVHRLVSEDPDLAEPSTLENLTVLSALEDMAEDLSPETADLVATFLARLGSDPKRALLALFLARQLQRDGDAAGARSTADAAIKAVGDDPQKNPYLADLLNVRGVAERRLKKTADAVATLKRSISIAEGTRLAPATRAARQLDLADALVAAGRKAEAKAAVDAALAAAGTDPGTLARAARVALALKEKEAALATARRAVELSLGEDAGAQAALGATLAANGDRTGAVSALRKATQIDPQNREYRRELAGLEKKGSAPATS